MKLNGTAVGLKNNENDIALLNFIVRLSSQYLANAFYAEQSTEQDNRKLKENPKISYNEKRECHSECDLHHISHRCH